jgi:hypothetical protein
VLCDYVLLWEKLEHVQLQPVMPDRFLWKWTADGAYSVSSAYRSFFIGRSMLVGAKHLWHADAPPKVRFFWVALHGRLWTAKRRRRHGLQQSASCVLCAQEDETTDHLLCSCVFAREVWYRLLLAAEWQALTPRQSKTLADWWQHARGRLPGELRCSFNSVVLLTAWNLWKERNRWTLDGVHRTVSQLCRAIVEEADAWVAAGFSSLAAVREAHQV